MRRPIARFLRLASWVTWTFCFNLFLGHGVVAHAQEQAVAPEASMQIEIEDQSISQDPPTVVALEDVIQSVARSFPMLELAILERVIAEGEQVASLGEFDLKFAAYSINQPLSFYQNYRHLTGLEQPLWGGGRLEAGYRQGHGKFEPWYGNRETDEGGEFRIGYYQPWLRDRRIDDRRANIFRANINRSAVEPFIQSEFIQFVREASLLYWDWVAAAAMLDVNEKLLELAEQRQGAIEAEVQLGEKGAIVLQDNGRTVATRRLKVIESQQKLREFAIKLSLYYRDADGQPKVLEQASSPMKFPQANDRSDEPVERDIQIALERRPELARLRFDRQNLEVELAQAQNLFRPQLDGYLIARDDIGAPTSRTRDKSPYELEAGVAFSTPIQRRKALGKIQSLRGKLGQNVQKLRFAEDKITAEVRAAVNNLAKTYERIEFAEEAIRLSSIVADAERERFRLGESGLLDVYLREDQLASAQLAAVDSYLVYYQALADLRAATAVDASVSLTGSGDNP